MYASRRKTGSAMNRGHDIAHRSFGYYSFGLAKIRTCEHIGGCGFLNRNLVRKPGTFAHYRYHADLFSRYTTAL